MKSLIKTFILAIGLLGILCNFASAEKYAPTDKVNEIMEAMGELEESYESANWAEALESSEKLEAEVKEIIALIKNDDLDLQIL